MSGRPGKRAWWDLEPCGTPAAYRRHLRRGQRPCERCRGAEALRWEERKGRLSRRRAAH